MGLHGPGTRIVAGGLTGRSTVKTLDTLVLGRIPRSTRSVTPGRLDSARGDPTDERRDRSPARANTSRRSALRLRRRIDLFCGTISAKTNGRGSGTFVWGGCCGALAVLRPEFARDPSDLVGKPRRDWWERTGWLSKRDLHRDARKIRMGARKSRSSVGCRDCGRPGHRVVRASWPQEAGARPTRRSGGHGPRGKSTTATRSRHRSPKSRGRPRPVVQVS